MAVLDGGQIKLWLRVRRQELNEISPPLVSGFDANSASPFEAYCWREGVFGIQFGEGRA